jgi:hypothetical protein
MHMHMHMHMHAHTHAHTHRRSNTQTHTHGSACTHASLRDSGMLCTYRSEKYTQQKRPRTAAPNSTDAGDAHGVLTGYSGYSRGTHGVLRGYSRGYCKELLPAGRAADAAPHGGSRRTSAGGPLRLVP